MKRVFVLLVLVVIPQVSLSQQSIPDYYNRYNFLMAPAGVFEDGLLGFANPAVLGLLQNAQMRFLWSTEGKEAASLRDWGLFSAVPNFGFSFQRQKIGAIGVTDFRLSTGFGSEAFAMGLGYGWSTGKFDALDRSKLLTTGAIIRPLRYVSVGLVGNFSVETSSKEGVGEIGIRPLGNPWLTLFADAAIQTGRGFHQTRWSAGASAQIVPGIDLVGRYFKSEAFTLGMTINFGGAGVAAQGHFDTDADFAYNNYMLRAGGTQPSVFPTMLDRGKRYVPFALQGRVDYLKYQLFDTGSISFWEVLKNIQAATDDPRVSALALNLSSMSVLPENAWEMREALLQARKAGKKVIIFLDNVEMSRYTLASAADKIVLDPEGSIVLPGFALSRTYLQGTLEKMGLGFDELRFFKYKSALETFSRDSMSEADRQQLQDFVDDWYDLVRGEVSTARQFAPEKFDEIVDDQVYILPQEALRIGLVDTLARWSAANEVVNNLTTLKLKSLPAQGLMANAIPFQNWGTTPEIALVYGIGVCALDEGIKARWLEQVFLGLAQKESVKALVFRVDSPGGDGMASDMVAEALKKCSQAKPVIVSQGQVAASGGYWISMYGDSILAGPNSITGSIGVIAGWLYNKAFTEKVGMTYDLVKRGAHADLGRGVTLPLIDVTIPARDLTTEERDKARDIILQFYDDFVDKVAGARRMPVDSVEAIAQGRIYSGLTGAGIGLVDRIGGLLTAIDMAKKMAGLKPGEEVRIVQMPEYKGFINLKEQFAPVEVKTQNDPVLQFIKMVSERPGRPLPIILPGTYPSRE